VVQLQYNEAHGITPQSIVKAIDQSLIDIAEADDVTVPLESDEDMADLTPAQRTEYIAELETRMREAAKKFEFEQAAQIRDKIKTLKTRDLAGAATPV
jgi:excinuclease ABC subunit B